MDAANMGMEFAVDPSDGRWEKDVRSRAGGNEKKKEDVKGKERYEGRGGIGAKGRLGETWTDRYRPKLFTELLGDEVLLFLLTATMFSQMLLPY